MTVLIAATGDLGATAAAALDGYEVVHVETLTAAREHLDSASVAVVGPLTEGSAVALTDCETAFVHLGPHEAFGTCLPSTFAPSALVQAVEAAREVVAYRQAVDELYERCTEAASRPPSEELLRELEQARMRADERFAAASESDRSSWDLLIDED